MIYFEVSSARLFCPNSDEDIIFCIDGKNPLLCYVCLFWHQVSLFQMRLYFPVSSPVFPFFCVFPTRVSFEDVELPRILTLPRLQKIAILGDIFLEH